MVGQPSCRDAPGSSNDVYRGKADRGSLFQSHTLRAADGSRSVRTANRPGSQRQRYGGARADGPTRPFQSHTLRAADGSRSVRTANRPGSQRQRRGSARVGGPTRPFQSHTLRAEDGSRSVRTANRPGSPRQRYGGAGVGGPTTPISIARAASRGRLALRLARHPERDFTIDGGGRLVEYSGSGPFD